MSESAFQEPKPFSVLPHIPQAQRDGLAREEWSREDEAMTVGLCPVFLPSWMGGKELRGLAWEWLHHTCQPFPGLPFPQVIPHEQD